MRYSDVSNWKIHIGLLNLSQDWFWDILRWFKTLQQDQNNFWIYLNLSGRDGEGIRFLCEVFFVFPPFSYLPLFFWCKTFLCHYSFMIFWFINRSNSILMQISSLSLSFTTVLSTIQSVLVQVPTSLLLPQNWLPWLYSFLFCPASLSPSLAEPKGICVGYKFWPTPRQAFLPSKLFCSYRYQLFHFHCCSFFFMYSFIS